MKCYNHHNNEAVGICKNCNKGVCVSCVKEVTNGIACSDICYKELIEVDALIQRNKNSSLRNANVYFRNAFIYGMIGIFFLILSYIRPAMNWYVMPFGVIFLVAMFIWLYTGFKHKK